MTETLPVLDPWATDDFSSGRFDASRVIGLPDADAGALAAAAAALANSEGGDIVLGAQVDGEGAVSIRGLDLASVDATVTDGLAQIDPPISHLVRMRRLTTEAGDLLIMHVRMSPSTPHMVTSDGTIPRLLAGTLRTVDSRRELDDLYARGRGERERADRLVDAMIEKLTLAHYAFYNIAIVGCTHEPSAEPFSAAAGGALAPADDPFVTAFNLAAQEPRVGPGEIEIRTEGEVGGYLRVARSGCVAAGEIQRRPYHDEWESVEVVERRLAALTASVCRLLGHAADAVMVPHLFVEGVRGLRLVLSQTPRATSGLAPQDTVRYALPLGDARDPDYPARLAADAMARLASLFPPRS